MKVSLDSQLEYGLLGHAAGGCRRAWFRDESDGAVPLLRILSRIGYVENAWNDQCVATLVSSWSFSPAAESCLRSRWTHPVGVDALDGATMARMAPFPPSSMPVYIEQSMRLFGCVNSLADFWNSLLELGCFAGSKVTVGPTIMFFKYFRCVFLTLKIRSVRMLPVGTIVCSGPSVKLISPAWERLGRR